MADQIADQNEEDEDELGEDPKEVIKAEGRAQVLEFLEECGLPHLADRFYAMGILYGMQVQPLTQNKLKNDMGITDPVDMEAILSRCHKVGEKEHFVKYKEDYAETLFWWSIAKPESQHDTRYVGNTPSSGGTYNEKWGIHPEDWKFFSKEGIWVTATGCDGMMFLWPVDHPSATPPAVRCGQPHFQICTSHVTDWDRMMTVSCGGDCRIQIYDMKTSKTVGSIKNNSKVDVSECFLSIAADLEVNKVCVGTAGAMVKVADIESKKIFLVMKGPLDDIYDVKVDWDLNQVVAGSWDHNLHIYDIRSGRKTKTLKGHNQIVNKIDVDFDQQLAVSVAWEDYMCLWDLKQAAMITSYHTPHHAANCICANWETMQCASGGSDGCVRFWDLESGECTKTIDCEFLHTLAVDVNWDLGLVLAGSWDQQVKLFDYHTGECLKKFKKARRVINSVNIKKTGDHVPVRNREIDDMPALEG